MARQNKRRTAATTDNWNARDYAQSSSAQMKWAIALLDKMELAGTETILDIGCGDGKVTRMLAEKVPEGFVLGIDRSEEMIALARERYQGKTISFQQMDGSAINLDRSFDFVFSNAVLHWVKDHQSVLKGIHCHLKPGGRMLLQMGGAGNADEIVRIISAMIAEPRWSPYFTTFEFPYYFYTDDHYLQWLPEAGFIHGKAHLFEIDMVHESADGLRRWLRTTWFPYTDCLPQELKNAFLNQLVSAYLGQYPVDKEGRTHVKMVRLEVRARKASAE